MKNRAQRNEDERDRKDPLFRFLGGDDMALRIFRALARDGVDTENLLREVYGPAGPGRAAGEYVADIIGIGPVALERIRACLGESG